MKLRDCELDSKGISMAPFIRREPEEAWQRAINRGQIPASLFELYRLAGYSSFDAAPPFLKDGDNVLFSYFNLILRSLALSLVEADEELAQFIAANKELYYPGRRIDDATWTKEKTEITSKNANDRFRNLLMSLHAALDVLAELIAVFGQGQIKGLEVGYGQFSRIEAWLKSGPPKTNLIATPSDLYLLDLHAKLDPLVNAVAPQADWLPYLRMLRNKAAHLGHGFFRSAGLPGNDGSYYTFIPRVWPYIWERDMKPSGLQAPISLKDMFLETLLHQDIIEYAEGARHKVRDVIDEALKITCKAYADFAPFTFNQAALDELNQNSKHFAFEHFL